MATREMEVLQREQLESKYAQQDHIRVFDDCRVQEDTLRRSILRMERQNRRTMISRRRIDLEVVLRSRCIQHHTNNIVQKDMNMIALEVQAVNSMQEMEYQVCQQLCLSPPKKIYRVAIVFPISRNVKADSESLAERESVITCTKWEQETLLFSFSLPSMRGGGAG